MWREKAVTALRKAGYKLTPQRLKLIEILEDIGSEHPALTEVLRRVRKEFPTMSFSTLYSNVLTLKKLGLIEVFSLNGETRVELNINPHINLIFGDMIVDLDAPEIIIMIENKVKKNVKLVNVLLD
ncbi:transcriptional repressor [Thermococcus argininiproducens]|uniref:Transcriptional repressor n=1 Tax=Thermococcus argininiproducens TaxID=2866384 RepID=A0A9E7MA74_9EURY|nr:Fur family transcriptional regulator [Thermococcus argininiproducens]USH00302.1 transcriptional repressor [Thermococcus argininiproducens]